jgi:hypothetical protein
MVRAAASENSVAVLSEDGTLRVYAASGAAKFQMETGVFWSFAFVPGTEVLMAYDPAANALLRVDEQGAAHMAHRLAAKSARYELGVDAGSGAVALLEVEGGRLVMVKNGAENEMAAPAGAMMLESLAGRGLLLTRDTGRPIWILDPSREEPLVAVPAVAAKAEVGQ